MNMEEIKQEAKESIPELKMPESIRTPGRTWTRYPKNLMERIEESDELEVDIETSGDTEVFTGNEAFDEAGKKIFDLIKKDENRLNAIHASKLNSLVYVRASGDSELHVNYEADHPVMSHLVIEATQGADLTVTEETSSSSFNTSFTEIYIEENASVHYGAVEKPEGFSYSRRKAIVQKYGSIDWLDGMFSGDLNRTKIETVLKGDNAETEKTGVWYPIGEQHHDISLEVHHIGNNTKCDMDSRSVVDDDARSLYEGLQQVQGSAVDTQSFQDQETLMISEDAESDASPKLMIENPNVEASHAAAAGTVDKDRMHYLKSRGMTDEKAEKLVVKGFFEPVMQDIKVPEVKERIRDEVRRKLQE